MLCFVSVNALQVDPEKFSADYVEFVFQDQYLGRNDMWRLGRALVGRCLYVEEQVSFIGVIAAKVQALYIGGKKVASQHISEGLCSWSTRCLRHTSHPLQK